MVITHSVVLKKSLNHNDARPISICKKQSKIEHAEVRYRGRWEERGSPTGGPAELYVEQ